MVLVGDGLFLLELAPGAPLLFFALAVLAAFFAREVGLPSILLGAWYLL
jgi:hypothetical protein